MGPTEKVIIDKLNDAFHPEELRLVNESHMHSGPAADSHFQLFMIADKFDGSSRIDRQRQVFKVLEAELAGPVHALSLRLLTRGEWDKLGNQTMPDSPNCAGGAHK